MKRNELEAERRFGETVLLASKERLKCKEVMNDVEKWGDSLKNSFETEGRQREENTTEVCEFEMGNVCQRSKFFSKERDFSKQKRSSLLSFAIILLTSASPEYTQSQLFDFYEGTTGGELHKSGI